METKYIRYVQTEEIDDASLTQQDVTGPVKSTDNENKKKQEMNSKM